MVNDRFWPDPDRRRDAHRTFGKRDADDRCRPGAASQIFPELTFDGAMAKVYARVADIRWDNHDRVA